jgi:predicted nucleic acid-binding protein
MFVLDTNIVSEVRRPRPHGGVIAWLKSVPAERIFLSAVTFGEIQDGIERLRERDPDQARAIAEWLDNLALSQAVLPMDEKAFRHHARLMHRRTKALFQDAMIAATAAVHGFTVATRNVRDFAALEVETVNPFDYRREG